MQCAVRAILVVVALLGVSVVFLSFMTWLTFDSNEIIDSQQHLTRTSVSGEDVKGVTDAGDGWVTAIAGGLTAATAVGAWLMPGRRQLTASIIATAGLIAATIAVYDIARDWAASRPEFLGNIGIDLRQGVTREPALWGLAAAGVATAAAGFALLATVTCATRLDSEAEQSGEGEAWA